MNMAGRKSLFFCSRSVEGGKKDDQKKQTTVEKKKIKERNIKAGS